MDDRDVKPENTPGLEVKPGRDDPHVYRIVAPRGWRFRGEQVDPHEVAYRVGVAVAELDHETRWAAVAEANDAATELRRHLEPCDCRRCE